MNRGKEFDIKLSGIRDYLKKCGADGVALQRSDNYAWAACGASQHVNTATDYGVATLIVTSDESVVVTNKIEAGRQKDEELKDLPLEIVELPWADNRDNYIRDRYKDKRLIADWNLAGHDPVPDSFGELLYVMTDSEIERFRGVGMDTAVALETAAKSLKPGMTEFEVAGKLSSECYARGIAPIVALIAADERLRKYRHPLPTGNNIEKTVMIVVCGRREGLIASATRIVSFGAPDKDLIRRHKSCALVDTTLNSSTRPGKPIADVFRLGMAAYKSEGYDGEWLLHHQGGPAGYKTRYYTANEGTAGVVSANMVFAWNPSITGTKVEDTIAVLEEKNVFLTQTGDWPYVEVMLEGKMYHRPDILVL